MSSALLVLSFRNLLVLNGVPTGACPPQLAPARGPARPSTHSSGRSPPARSPVETHKQQAVALWAVALVAALSSCGPDNPWGRALMLLPGNPQL